MTTSRTLEINRLDSNGEVTRSISCLSGRITVFRSVNDVDSDLFTKALWGEAAPGTFSILLSGLKYIPKDVSRIGFNDLRILEPGKTLRELLSKIPLPEGESFESFLMKVGLGGLEDQILGELTPTHQRIALILRGSIEAVLILHEPFEGLGEATIEYLANYLVTRAWKDGLLVVVTKLSIRPQCWLENPHISRAQLQRPRKATIGFGAGDPSVNQMIEEVRSSYKPDAPVGRVMQPTLTRDPQNSVFVLTKFHIIVGIAASSVAGILIVGIVTIFTSFNNNPMRAASIDELLERAKVSEQSLSATSQQSLNSSQGAIRHDASTYIDPLNGYPNEIRQGIKVAFEGSFSKESVRDEPRLEAPSENDFDALYQKLL